MLTLLPLITELTFYEALMRFIRGTDPDGSVTILSGSASLHPPPQCLRSCSGITERPNGRIAHVLLRAAPPTAPLALRYGSLTLAEECLQDFRESGTLRRSSPTVRTRCTSPRVDGESTVWDTSV